MAGAFTAALVAGCTAGSAVATPAAGAPAVPGEVELFAGSDMSVTLTWTASPGARRYNIYRGTRSGGEATTPIATTMGTSYRDTNLSSTPVYWYQITAVNAAGESARTEQDASKTPPPVGTGGDTAGLRSGRGWLYYAKDAWLGGFDWFPQGNGWFPQVLDSSGSATPGQQVVDMAYSTRGTLMFRDVAVPASGLYTLDWRYAFGPGFFPAVFNRRMGLRVNGVVITRTERFPRTGSFDVYGHSALQVWLHAGMNTVTAFAVTDHGVGRIDQLTVTPATASVPSAPTRLAARTGAGGVTLTWVASRTGHPTSYTIYRGSAADGESPTPIATTSGATTTFTDTGLHAGTTYYYTVAADNRVGVSPDADEVTATPGQ